MLACLDSRTHVPGGCVTTSGHLVLENNNCMPDLGHRAVDLTKHYRDLSALDHVNMQVQRGGSSGLLLLPGCPVDPVAYAPLARRVAEQGHPAIIVKVPYRCASLPRLEAQLDRRVQALAATSETTRWVLFPEGAPSVLAPN